MHVPPILIKTHTHTHKINKSFLKEVQVYFPPKLPLEMDYGFIAEEKVKRA